jgi:S1-C subfamily serine protease
MNRIRWYGPSILLLVALVAVMVLGPSLMRQLTWTRDDTRITLIADTLPNMPALEELSRAFKLVGEMVEPSVVHIQAVQEQAGGRFIGRTYPSGSGWVYDEHGHIVTNNHVVESATEIRVKFADGSERDARLVGGDPKTDVAVIKVDGGWLHPAHIAKDAVTKGDIVFAFGSPLHFEFSMSQGIVSATGRRLGLTDERGRFGMMIRSGYENFIQTDAAINPGNSGGPLTNIHGEVIGMNTAIASEGPSRRGDGTYIPGGFIGLGFAIPVDIIVPVADQIIANNGRIERGYMGVYISDMTPAMAKTYGYDGVGVLVDDPVEGLPGARAGLQRGDIITEIEGRAMTTADDLRFKVASYPPGSKIEVKYFRDGELQTATVTLDRLPGSSVVRVTPDVEPAEPEEAEPAIAEAPDQQAEAETVPPQDAALRRYGFTSVGDMTPEAAERMRVDYHPGVLVLGVERGSPAAEAAIFAQQQIITGVMGQPVENIEQLTEALAAQDPDKPVRISAMMWDPSEKRWLNKFHVLEPDSR